MKVKLLSIFMFMALLTGCKSHYQYGTGTPKVVKQVKTDIQTIRLTSLSGMNIGEYRWDFKQYLKDELAKRTYISLDPKSTNQLYIKAYVADIVSTRKKDKVFGVKQFQITKSISVRGNIEVEDKNEKVIVEETYEIGTEKTEITKYSFKATENKHKREGTKDKLYEKILKSIARMVVSEIIEDRGVEK